MTRGARLRGWRVPSTLVAEVEHAKAGKQKTLGVPLKLSATPGGVRRAAPALGQHDDEIKKAKVQERRKGAKRWSEPKESLRRSR